MAHTTTEAVSRHQITTALSVITNPEHFAHNPHHLQTAWQTLKEARGQTVDLHRVGPAAYRVETLDPPVSRAQAMSRHCLERLRRHAAAKNIPIVSTVWPSDGDAA